MKAIIIGPSLSGKTTIARVIRSQTSIPVLEIDEELTTANGGRFPEDDEYKNTKLAPQIIADILNREAIIFFTNTNYLTEMDIRTARDKGFKVLSLNIPLEELKARNKKRVIQENYDDAEKWLEGMIAYQQKMESMGLYNSIIDGTQTEDHVVSDILNVLK